MGVQYIIRFCYLFYLHDEYTQTSQFIDRFSYWIFFYTLSIGLDSIMLLVFFCLCYFILVKYSIKIIWRKTVFITGISLMGIYQSMKQERAFQFDIHGNYFFPYFESTMTVFWLIYGLCSIFFILILKDKKHEIKNNL